MRVERCQERSFVDKMYLKKCLQSIGLCVDCHSGQFMCYLLHCHGLMVFSADGLVQVAWIQTYPYLSVWFPRKGHWKDPWCWLYLLHDDFLFYQVVQFLSIASFDWIGTFLPACDAGLTVGSTLMLYAPFKLSSLSNELGYSFFKSSTVLHDTVPGSW